MKLSFKIILLFALLVASLARGAGLTVSTANGYSVNQTVDTSTLTNTTTAKGPWTGKYNPLLIQTNTMFVSTNGNDSTAILGNPNQPWRHGIVALNSSQPGYTIQFGPGLFTSGETISQAQSLMAWTNVTIKGAGRDSTVWSPQFTATGTGNLYVLYLSGTNFVSDIDIVSSSFNLPFVVVNGSFDTLNRCRLECTNANFGGGDDSGILIGDDGNFNSFVSTNTLIVNDTEFDITAASGAHAIGVSFDNDSLLAYSTNVFHRCTFNLGQSGSTTVVTSISANLFGTSPVNAPWMIFDACYVNQLGAQSYIEQGVTNELFLNTTFVSDSAAHTPGPIGTPGITFPGQFSRYFNCQQVYYDSSSYDLVTNFMGYVVGKGFTGNGAALTNAIGAPAAFWTDLTNEFGGWQVDSKYGSDTTGFPSKTISNGVWLASNAVTNTGLPQLVVVHSGTYNENNLLRPGVNFYFSTGAKVVWNVPSTNTVSDYWAIFDDRSTGPTTNLISGTGDFKWQGWTNYLTSTGMTTGGSNQSISGTCGGVVMITNPATSITISANSMQGSSWTELGAAVISASYGNLTANLNWMSDPYGGTNLLFTNIVSHTTVNKQSSCIGVAWNCGVQHIHCWSNSCGQTGTRGNDYALWGNGFSPSDVGDFYYDGDFIGGKIYTSFQTLNSVWWVHVKRDEVINMPVGGSSTTQNPLSLFGSQKAYIFADKMSASSAGMSPGIYTIDDAAQSGTSDVRAWIYIGKLVTSNYLFNLPLGQVYINALQVDDLSAGNGAGGGTASIAAGGAAGLILNYMPSTNHWGSFFLTNPIVGGAFWTNTTGVQGTLTVNYTLPSLTSSLGMTNLSTGEWINATNATGSARASFRVEQMEIMEITNKSGTPTVDGSWFKP